MRAAFLCNVVALALLLVCGEAEARKLYVRDVRVSPACLSISRDALMSRVAELMPRDVLNLRGLGYEHLAVYLDVSDCNDDRFEVRRCANVLNRLRQLDMAFMLRMEVSCLPEGGRARYLLTGRMTDLDAVDRILACPRAHAGTRDGRRVCNVDGQVFDAVSFTSVEMASFDDFTAAMRTLLARLLHVPELRVGTDTRTFDPSEEVSLPFLVQRNDGTESGYQGTPAPLRRYRMRQDVLELPSDLFDAVCQGPDRHWRQIACGRGFATEDCDPADRVRYEVRRLVHDDVPARALPELPRDEQGGDRIAFRAPAHRAFYVVRAEAVAVEERGEVHSNPVYACLRVRSRGAWFGVASRLGVSFGSIASGRTYPTAGFIVPAWGIDATLQYHLASSGISFMPNLYLDANLGFTRVDGAYPCPTGDPQDCRSSGEVPRHADVLSRTSTSSTFEARARLTGELFRVGRVAPLVFSEFGFGAELVESRAAQFPNDGWGPLAIVGAGGGLSLTLAGTGRLSTRVSLLAHWQMRQRTTDRATPIYLRGPAGVETWFNAAGVPDSFHVLWVSLGVSLAPPSSR